MSIVPYLIPTDRLFVPQLFRDNNNQNIKTLYYWAFGSGIIRMTSVFPSQGSNYYGICFHINVGPCIYSFWSFFRVTTPVITWLRCVKDLRFKCYFDIVSILDRYSSRYQAIKMDFRWENISIYTCVLFCIISVLIFNIPMIIKYRTCITI